MTITAAKLIAKQKSQASGRPLIVRDLSDPKRPVRLITFALVWMAVRIRVKMAQRNFLA